MHSSRGKRIKNVTLVDCRKLKSNIPAVIKRCDAVYVGISIAEGREDVVRELLAAGKSVLVEHPAAPSASGIATLQQLARKTRARLVEAVPPRFAMSWERLIGTLHAEVGSVKRIDVEFVTGRVRRFVLRLWSCLCPCGCCLGRSKEPQSGSGTTPIRP